MHRSSDSWTVSRRFVAGVAAAVVALPWVHALAVILRSIGPEPDGSISRLLTGAVVLATGAGVAALPHRFGVGIAALAGGIAVAVAEAVAPGAWPSATAVPMVAGVATWGALALGSRLPAGVDRILGRRPAVAVLWTLLALTSVIQTGRLSTFMADPEVDLFLATDHPFWFGHQCLSAYLHGAELAERGVDNLYDPARYPGLAPDAEPVTGVQGMVVEDPYQYPPQFLILPWLALQVSHDYVAIRTVWLALNLSLFLAAFAGLAQWVGGRAGRLCLWSGPGVLIALPVLYDLQYGQFHLAAVSLAVLGMLGFARGRRSLGGLAMALAIAAKLFPAVLLLPLLLRRRLRELGWTAAWGVALTVGTLALFGPAPFEAFFVDHLPRLGDGSAFAFDEAWPELADLVTADNQGVFGLARKVGLSKPASAALGRIYGLGVLLLAAGVGLWRGPRSRWGIGTSWLALLGLASLASPGAWGDYVAVVPVWLVALVAAPALRVPWLRAPLALTAILQWTLLGTIPLGDALSPGAMFAVSALGVVSMLGLFAGALKAAAPRRPAEVLADERRTAARAA